MAQRDVTILIKAMDRATKTLQSVSKAGTKAFKSMRVGVIGLTAALGAAGFAYSKLISSGVRYNAELEKYNAILTTVFGSQQRANQAMKEAIDFAAQTPFQVPQVVEATARLETFGIAARKNLRWIGDMAAATGKSIMQAVEALIDAQMGEFERLKEFGIKKELLVPFGLMLDKQGAITDMDSVLVALERFAGKWSGQMGIMSGTFNGLVSNLRDQWSSILGVLAKPLFERAKVEIKALLDIIVRLKQTGRLKEILQGWSDAGKELIRIFATFVRGTGRNFLDIIQRSGDAVLYFLSTLDNKRISKWVDQMIAFSSAVAKMTVSISKFLIQHAKLIAAFAALTIISTMTLKVIAFGEAVVALTVFLGPTGLLFALAGVVTFLMTSYVPSMDDALRKTQEVLDLAARAGEYFELVQAMKSVRDQIELVAKAEEKIIGQRQNAIRGQKSLAKIDKQNKQELINLANERLDLELALNELEKKKRALLGKTVIPIAEGERPGTRGTNVLIAEVKIRDDIRAKEINREIQARLNAQLAILDAMGLRWKAEDVRARIQAAQILKDTGDQLLAERFLQAEFKRISGEIKDIELERLRLIREAEEADQEEKKRRELELLALKQQRLEAERRMFADAQRRNLQEAERTFQAQAAMYQAYAGLAMDAEAAISMAVNKRFGALAGHILRVITQLVAQNKLQLAHEKYIQAAQFKTHGEFMAQKAFEAQIMAALAFFSGNFASAAGFQATAASAAAASIASLAGAAATQTSARASLAQGIGIQTAGELGAAALGGIGGGGGTSRVVVNQTNTFNGIVESNSKEQLREWAELLQPYMEDVKRKAEE